MSKPASVGVHLSIALLLLATTSAWAAWPVSWQRQVTQDGQTRTVLPGSTHRLYDGLTAHVVNPQGKAFNVHLAVRDVNRRMQAPSELMAKIYSPDGKPVVREILPDDGVVPSSHGAPFTGWDSEEWYYATEYSRGLTPMMAWSEYSSPARLLTVPARTFDFKVDAKQSGVYRIVLVGTPDLYVSMKIDPDLAYSLAGSPEWIHGHDDLLKRTYVYVPRTAGTIDLLLMQFDEPASRTVVIKDPQGKVITWTTDNGNVRQASVNGGDGFQHIAIPIAGQYDEQVLTVEVSDGPGDYLLNVTFQMVNDFVPTRAKTQGITALLSPDKETAKATQGGAIYHDGQIFWQMYQVRLYDWVKAQPKESFDWDHSLFNREGYVSVGSHQTPTFGGGSRNARAIGTADLIMHNWADHKDPKALNAAIADMLFATRLIGPSDHLATGPLRNLAYEMGCYAFYWYRPAWRILTQTDAPKPVKDALMEFMIQAGDRLIMCRTVATVNGNAFASMIAAIRYISEATQDPLQIKWFDTLWDRFCHGGYGNRVGIGPSGGIQESCGYDYHYGSYVFRGWRAILQDIKDPRMIKAMARIDNLYSYLYQNGSGANPYSSRTGISKTAGGTYSPHGEHPWKGDPGPDFTVSVNDGNEFFAARRPDYYILTYHGRLSPVWIGEGFQGQIGHGGGGICQLVIPGAGQVLSASPNGDYGNGMHPSQWRNFHIHGLVGTTNDGAPFVAANSEQFNARLDGNVLTSSGPIRRSSMTVSRKYTFEDAQILVEAQLHASPHDNVFALWGGRPHLRGKVDEAYEMIPFHDAPIPRGKPRDPVRGRTKIILLDNEGNAIGQLGDDSVKAPATVARAIMIDRGDHGIMIELDQDRPVQRAKNDALLIELARGDSIPADQVGISYRIVPYRGKQPQVGQVAQIQREDEKITRIDPVPNLDGVAAALKNIEPMTIKHDGKAMVQLRFALSGDNLALLADVTARKITREDRVWRGSCLEVFGSDYADNAPVGQVFLAPSLKDVPAEGYVPKGSEQVVDPDIQIASSPSENGFQLRALIPLSKLRLDGSAERIRLEFQISTDVTGKGIEHETLFGSTRAYQQNYSYGIFKIN